jgi:hypothetical protein
LLIWRECFSHTEVIRKALNVVFTCEYKTTTNYELSDDSEDDIPLQYHYEQNFEWNSESKQCGEVFKICAVVIKNSQLHCIWITDILNIKIQYNSLSSKLCEVYESWKLRQRIRIFQLLDICVLIIFCCLAHRGSSSSRSV